MDDSHNAPADSSGITYTELPESAGRDTADQLRLLIENVTDYAIVTLDTHGHVASWNPGAERIKGYRAEEILGQHFSRFYPPEALAKRKPWKALEVAAREGRFAEEGWRVRRDGSRFWANVVISALYEDGRLRGFGKVVRDFTDRKQAEERRELERLREALHDRDVFLSVASHELKTPLTPLQLKLTSLQRLAENTPEGALSSARVARELDVARRQVRKLADLIEDLLDVSRINVGKLSLEPEPMDLAAAVREVVARYTPQAAQVDSTLTLDAPAPVEGVWDKRRLDQVVTNLITNALKYGAGGPVHVRVSTENGESCLSVRDEGIGIAPEDQPRIFDRFVRAVSERNYGGMGLGLFITQQVVEAHGGEIRVHSAPGQGATFTVRLPPGSAPSGR
ncbi:PAS domain-containing sensor histidine kinase [Myxococcus sp. RHSTA-1-4]|uniref:PAS domain-containing sensor histidine kinase n=1 Tax=Myxococcus sp. RHSTA-1-4 TaxID=2874601 RepID=UPI001CC161A1|nr:PAS domain-containing sensor histidine kinase [Myxococcus sp. RHSTA-1-4]MBZ4416617.1 PAS domain-containing sensor histidine kinase [Myxococcus sp. RHSTA-1-4]